MNLLRSARFSFYRSIFLSFTRLSVYLLVTCLFFFVLRIHACASARAFVCLYEWMYLCIKQTDTDRARPFPVSVSVILGITPQPSVIVAKSSTPSEMMRGECYRKLIKTWSQSWVNGAAASPQTERFEDPSRDLVFTCVVTVSTARGTSASVWVVLWIEYNVSDSR